MMKIEIQAFSERGELPAIVELAVVAPDETRMPVVLVFSAVERRWNIEIDPSAPGFPDWPIRFYMNDEPARIVIDAPNGSVVTHEGQVFHA